MKTVLKATWLGCAVFVLVASLYLYDGKPNSDADVILAYGMLGLAVPVGFLLAAIAALAFEALHATTGYVVEVSYTYIAVTWACFAIAGYLQWFVLLPWLIGKIRLRRVRSY